MKAPLQILVHYLALRKQLKMEKTQFILCISGLSQQQAQGMISMYDLTFEVVGEGVDTSVYFPRPKQPG